MTQQTRKRIVELVLEAAALARSIGIPNLLQPGLVKEMILADILGHELVVTKRLADACDPNDPSILYEYLSCIEGGKGQFDRMFKAPPEKRAESLERIYRNRKIYLAVFYRQDQTRVKAIYELGAETVAVEAERQLDRSRNAISHIGFSETWAKKNGMVVFEDNSES